MSRSLFLAWMVGGLSLVASVMVAQESKPQPKPNMKMVSIEVVIADYSAPKSDEGEKMHTVDNPAERLKLLEKQGRVGSVARIRLSTLDQLPAMVQIGEVTPVVTGRNRMSGAFGGDRGGGGERPGGGGVPGAGFNSVYSMQNIGTLLNVTPHIEESGTIVVTLQIERSRLIPPPATPDPAGNEQFIPRTTTTQAKTSVRISPGQTVMVSGSKIMAKDEAGEQLIMVTASITDPSSAKPTANKTSSDNFVRAFQLAHMKASSASESASKILDATQIRLTVDPRTNSIIASGSPDGLAILEALLKKLDAAP